MQDTLTVIYFPIGKPHELVTIPYTLEEMQRLVDGYIESVFLCEGVTMICNEEGKLRDLPPNRIVGGELIVGNFFVTGVDGEEFAPLAEGQIQEVLVDFFTCAYCREDMLADEPLFQREQPNDASQTFHRECGVRAIIGSAAHQLHECSCYGGEREDPPGMTVRQAAKLAYETFRILGAEEGAQP